MTSSNVSRGTTSQKCRPRLVLQRQQATLSGGCRSQVDQQRSNWFYNELLLETPLPHEQLLSVHSNAASTRELTRYMTAGPPWPLSPWERGHGSRVPTEEELSASQMTTVLTAVHAAALSTVQQSIGWCSKTDAMCSITRRMAGCR